MCGFGETSFYHSVPVLGWCRSFAMKIDNKDIRSKIMAIEPKKRKELKINKSTLWYQQKKIKDGKTIKMYNKSED